jgi:arginase
VPGFEPIPDNRIALIGTRDIDSLESALLDDSEVAVVAPRRLREDLPRALQPMTEHVDEIYVHLDLDVLDAGVAAANQFAVTGGLTVEDVGFALSRIGQVFRIAGVALTAYDPEADSNGRAARAAIQLISTAASVAGRA